jgi:hypothetical protein
LLNQGCRRSRVLLELRAGIDETTDRGAAVRSVVLNRHALPRSLPFALALVAGALSVPAPTHGLTLGAVASLSALGQPLRVVIPVALSAGESLNAACVKLVADNPASGAPQIVTGRVSLEQEAAGARIVITTARAVSEPALGLAVEAGCGSTTRRDYVLLLDPPNSESPTMVATADADEAPWTRIPRQNAKSPATPQRPPVTVASALPPSTWGAPVPTSEPLAEARPRAPERKIATEPTPASPVAVPPGPRELVAVSNNSGGGSFISEATAANLPTRSAAPRATSPQSLPLTQPVWRSQQQHAPVSIWQQVWPYTAAIFGSIAMVLIAFEARRRRAARSSWLDPQSRESLQGETQASAAQGTFAHLGELTEPEIAPRRTQTNLPAIPERSPEVSELDTLLQDIQADMIDERTIKEAWKAAATESPMDMGRDSILNAIAAAERDLQIGAPEPAQVAMDNALETDLLTVPNTPMKVRFG